jgi:competence protein ComEC
MAHITVTIFGLVYIFALLLSGVFGFPTSDFSWSSLTLPVLFYGSLGLIIALILPRFWRTGPSFLGIILPFIAIFATLFLQFRYPQPEMNDISNFVSQFQGELTTVTGKIINNPTLNSQDKVRFLLQVNKVKNLTANISGKLYVTVPLLQGTGLSSGQNLTLTGRLYAPQANLNPGGFDFREYLAKQGVFAGLKGFQVNEYGPQKWGFWKLRQRIVKAQVRFLSSPVGPLVSSIVLGGKAVDLPSDIRDNFIAIGLAHALAASGFQVALLLGVLLHLINGFSEKNKLILGTVVIIFYVSLTGVQPSVIRAAIMGFGALIGMVTERKVRPFGFLVLTALILLFINPLWIFDLSFQFSFLATLGLIVTVKPIVNKLDFLPPTISNLIAIPVAATIWCLPLCIYIFKSISLYSIFVNILVTPLVAGISLMGMLSAFFALIFPFFGSMIAAILYYPTYFLIAIVQFFVNLPYSYLAIGQLSLIQLIIIYTVIILVWLNNLAAKQWHLFAIFIIGLIAIPIIYNNLNLTQVTVLASQNEPIIVIQNQGKFALINKENPNNEKYIVKPFLAQQGINNLDVRVNLKDITNRKFSLNKDVNITIFNNYLQLDIKEQKWFLFDQNLTHNKNLPLGKNSSPDVILWSGNTDFDWLNIGRSKVAIASTNTLNNSVKQTLEKANIKLYITGENGAIQWTQTKGFYTKSFPNYW